MSDSQATCWHLIRGAAQGDAEARSEFAGRYAPLLRSYLRARWRESPLLQEVEDTMQDVFGECFCEQGILERADPERAFRPFLYGVLRRAAQRAEVNHARRHRDQLDKSFHPDQLEIDETSLSRVFDRKWAKTVIWEAEERFLQDAEAVGGDRLRRAKLLQKARHDDRRLRQLAADWPESPERLHHQFSQAKTEFRRVFREVVSVHTGCQGAALDEQCQAVIGLALAH